MAKFNNYGFLDWGTYFKGTEGWSVATDHSYNVYLSGYVNNNDSLATPGAYQNIYGGGLSDGYLSKFDSAGNLIWSTYFGGPGDEKIYGLTTDSADNVYISGFTNSISGIISPGRIDTVINDSDDIGFLAKFNSNGILKWSNYYAGVGFALATDSLANIYITGYSTSYSGLDTNITAIDPGNSNRIFLSKFDSSGNLVWGNYYGYNIGSGDNQGLGLALDKIGNVFIVGETSCDSGMVTTDTHLSTFTNHQEAIFLADFDNNGNLLYGTYYAGEAYDYDIAFGVATDGNGNVYFTGLTDDTSGIATYGAYDTHFNGGDDALLVKFYFPPTSIPSIEKTADEVVLMPNPTHHSVNLSSAVIINTVVVSDLLGQVLYTGAYNAYTASIDLSTYPNGIYLLRVNGDTVYKVVKE